MEILLLLAMNGLIWGLIIALIALGLSIIFGLLDIINIAHGDFFMVGTMIAWVTVQQTGNFWLAFLLAPLLGFALGPHLRDGAFHVELLAGGEVERDGRHRERLRCGADDADFRDHAVERIAEVADGDRAQVVGGMGRLRPLRLESLAQPRLAHGREAELRLCGVGIRRPRLQLPAVGRDPLAGLEDHVLGRPAANPPRPCALLPPTPPKDPKPLRIPPPR